MDNEKQKNSRRIFIKGNLLAGMGALVGIKSANAFISLKGAKKNINTPAILGGLPVMNPQDKPKWSKWPIWDRANDEPEVLSVLRSGVWSRASNGKVVEFEEKWAKLIGTNRCLATMNGTNALICSIANLDIGGGDEVILPPYTFIACPQSILMNGAMPVFVDTDPATFQMDPEKIEASITPRTRAIMAVHIAGLPSDMKRIMEIAKKHNLVVIEDACQAWLAEINHKKVGTFGDAGCFSFQNSKNITMGEGGAIVSNNEEFMDRCYSYHVFGNAYGTTKRYGSGSSMLGTKIRLTEIQAAIGLAQLKRLEKQTDIRNENAMYLKSEMDKIPGITPFKTIDGVTRAAFHLFPFHYHKEEFSGLSREVFQKSLAAEGVPVSTGYGTLNDQPYLKYAFQTKNFKKMYPQEMLDFDKYLKRTKCPKNDKICNEEGMWFYQSLLLGPRSDMDHIVAAINKIRKNADAIKKSVKD